jgi:hypothetical protein
VLVSKINTKVSCDRILGIFPSFTVITYVSEKYERIYLALSEGKSSECYIGSHRRLSSKMVNLEEPIGYPAQPGLICPSVRPSVHPYVHARRLGIERKIAQAQKIWSIILQNHESTSIVIQKFFKKKI